MELNEGEIGTMPHDQFAEHGCASSSERWNPQVVAEERSRPCKWLVAYALVASLFLLRFWHPHAGPARENGQIISSSLVTLSAHTDSAQANTSSTVDEFLDGVYTVAECVIHPVDCWDNFKNVTGQTYQDFKNNPESALTHGYIRTQALFTLLWPNFHRLESSWSCTLQYLCGDTIPIGICPLGLHGLQVQVPLRTLQHWIWNTHGGFSYQKLGKMSPGWILSSLQGGYEGSLVRALAFRDQVQERGTPPEFYRRWRETHPHVVNGRGIFAFVLYIMLLVFLGFCVLYLFRPDVPSESGVALSAFVAGLGEVAHRFLDAKHHARLRMIQVFGDCPVPWFQQMLLDSFWYEKYTHIKSTKLLRQLADKCVANDAAFADLYRRVQHGDDTPVHFFESPYLALEEPVKAALREEFHGDPKCQRLLHEAEVAEVVKLPAFAFQTRTARAQRTSTFNFEQSTPR